MRLIAQSALPRAFKNMKGGRVLPGDEFEATPKDGKLLIAVKKAKLSETDPGDLAPPPANVASVIGPMKAAQLAEAELEALRAQAEALGIEVDGRWRAARLQEEIANATEHPAPKNAEPTEEAKPKEE